MRLIDADKLEADIEYWEQHAELGMEDYDKRDIEQVVWSQPTVEAIPMKWILEKIAANIYQYEHQKDKLFVEEGVVRVVSYSITANVLNEMIEDWREENEAD